MNWKPIADYFRNLNITCNVEAQKSTKLHYEKERSKEILYCKTIFCTEVPLSDLHLTKYTPLGWLCMSTITFFVTGKV